MEKPGATSAVLSQQGRKVLGLLAFLYLDNKRPAKAHALLKVFESLHLEDPETCLLLAWAQLQSGLAAQALHTMDRASRVGASGGGFHLLRARCLCSLGRYAEAHADMQAYIAARTVEAA